MSNDLLLLRDSTIEQAFITGDGVDTAIVELSDIVRGYTHNLETVGGRKKTASLAAKVSKVKTKMDAIGKELVSDWKSQAKIVDANRKKLRDACDELRDEARKPLTDWEAEEAEKVAAAEAKIEADKAAALLESDHEIALLLNEKFDDDAEAAIIIAAQQAEQRQAELRDQIAAEEKVKAENVAADAIENAKRIEREAVEAVERANEAAERAEIDKAEALVKAEHDAAEAVEREIARTLATEIAAGVEIERREADKRHVGQVRRRAKESLMAIGLTEDQAKSVVLAIHNKKIESISITY